MRNNHFGAIWCNSKKLGAIGAIMLICGAIRKALALM